MSEKRDSGKTIQEKASVLWDVANSLFGLYKPHEYGLVILPMAIIKRFHDCLLPTYALVQKEFAAKKNLAVKEAFLKAASGYNFYNTSKFTFETLLAAPKNIGVNFRDYLNGFSDNVRDVLEQMEFEKEVATMEKGGVLYQVISDFNSAKADMSKYDLSLYVTAEPCVMCMGGIMWSGIKAVYYGVPSKRVEKIAGFDDGYKPGWLEAFAQRGIKVEGGIAQALGEDVLREYVEGGYKIYKPER